MRERRGVYMVLVGKLDGNRQLGRPRRRLGDNIKTVLHEMTWERDHGLNLSGSGLGQFAGCCERGNEHSGFIKWEEFLD
jgi:hypothetical protein